MDVSPMSQSLARLIIHITLSTKRRTPWLRDRAVRNALYEYMGGILKALDSKTIRIHGVEDHVTGYAAHSVSPSQLEAVDQYVANQEAHHTRMTFQEELRIICRKNGIELDERFAWD